MRATSEVGRVKREQRRKSLPQGWAWLRRLRSGRGWIPPLKPALNLNQLRRIAYL